MAPWRLRLQLGRHKQLEMAEPAWLVPYALAPIVFFCCLISSVLLLWSRTFIPLVPGPGLLDQLWLSGNLVLSIIPPHICLGVPHSLISSGNQISYMEADFSKSEHSKRPDKRWKMSNDSFGRYRKQLCHKIKLGTKATPNSIAQITRIPYFQLPYCIRTFHQELWQTLIIFTSDNLSDNIKPICLEITSLCL